MMTQSVLLFSNDKIFNEIISDSFSGSGIYKLQIIREFMSKKNTVKFKENDIPVLLISKKNNLDDFVIFLSNQSYKGIYIVFGSKKEERNFTENKAVFIDIPFSLIELMQALHSIKIQRREVEYHDIKFKKIFLNMTSKSIGNSKVSIKLTDKEIKILWHLVKEKNSIVNQNFLLNKVWGYKDDIETKTLTTHIYTMRKKLDYFNGIFTIENSDEGYFIKFK
jgi:hypothetical protein